MRTNRAEALDQSLGGQDKYLSGAQLQPRADGARLRRWLSH
jgi:hypothetical protein